ncbi:hypothetical protein P9D39_26325, partial [Heyndrickxia oleronia]|uniref:hypothetical protein n=1 Tax=Heyndrickxia oleronia TaxID=38875 RepID=UPI001B8038CF
MTNRTCQWFKIGKTEGLFGMPSFVLFALNEHITNHWRVCQERLRQHLLKFREEIHPLELIFHRTFDTT